MQSPPQQRRGSTTGGRGGGGGALQRRMSMNRRLSQAAAVTYTDSLSYGDNEGDESKVPLFTSIGAKETEPKSEIEMIRLQVKAFFAYSTAGQTYDWVLLFLSSASCILFIYQTYLATTNLFA